MKLLTAVALLAAMVSCLPAVELESQATTTKKTTTTKIIKTSQVTTTKKPKTTKASTLPSTTSGTPPPATTTSCGVPVWGQCYGQGYTGCTKCATPRAVVSLFGTNAGEMVIPDVPNA
ncbi:hypothetical protein ABW19_dt0210255 [Dactylella cylindrospora]|nr:hypothetical protein ABW19_dt0210255 [Dactylella cylindrospora]